MNLEYEFCITIKLIPSISVTVIGHVMGSMVVEEVKDGGKTMSFSYKYLGIKDYTSLI